MLFTLTITALLSTLAAAAPNPQTSTPTPNEIASVTDFLVRRHGSTVDVVDFKLTGRNATDLACTASGPKLSTIYNCGESKYRFSLSNGTETDYGLVVYHEVAFAFGFWGTGDVPTVCRAGGNGPDDYVCTQVSPVEIPLNV